MSEEEIIQDLQNYIVFAKKKENYSDLAHWSFEKEFSKRIKSLLGLYNKEKERTDKLQKENKESKELYNKLLIGYNKLVQEYLELEKENQKKDKVIEELKNKLEVHIAFCEQEARGHINNNVCHISLRFAKSLLEIIKKVEEEDVN